MAVEKPNLSIDVTGKFDLKLAALREPDSQVANMYHLDELITGWLTNAGRGRWVRGWPIG
jgi:LmbE family N-acetylglucosaminyl deacetylase